VAAGDADEGSAGREFGNYRRGVVIFGLRQDILDDRKVIQNPADNYVAEGCTLVPRVIGVTGNVRF
jgi:hypothetical protein